MGDSQQTTESINRAPESKRGKGLAIVLGGMLLTFAIVSGAYLAMGGRYEFILTNLKANLGIAPERTATPSPRHRTQPTKKENYVYGN
jgi:hypothetical protein